MSNIFAKIAKMFTINHILRELTLFVNVFCKKNLKKSEFPRVL